MYANRFVVAVKVNGQVLRETKDAVALPFGSEYSVLLKNLNSVRSQVKVSIDGEDAAGTLVIGPNSTLELERFIRNGNLSAGNRFKFIERSAAVEAHRGVKVDDGLVRVEYQFERPQPEIIETIVRERREPYYPHPCPLPHIPYPRRWSDRTPMRPMMGRPSGRLGKATPSRSPGMRSMMRPQGASARSVNMSFSGGEGSATMDCAFTATARAGITVAGSESNQQFHYVSGFPLEAQSHVIVLRLVGMVGKLAVANPVTVKQKPTCSTCGKKNKAGVSFCADCGTALVLI